MRCNIHAYHMKTVYSYKLSHKEIIDITYEILQTWNVEIENT